LRRRRCAHIDRAITVTRTIGDIGAAGYKKRDQKDAGDRYCLTQDTLQLGNATGLAVEGASAFAISRWVLSDG
jgi:hypothetical protein